MEATQQRPLQSKEPLAGVSRAPQAEATPSRDATQPHDQWGDFVGAVSGETPLHQRAGGDAKAAAAGQPSAREQGTRVARNEYSATPTTARVVWYYNNTPRSQPTVAREQSPPSPSTDVDHAEENKALRVENQNLREQLEAFREAMRSMAQLQAQQQQLLAGLLSR